ncbi:hypothetical protein FRC12_019121, partial [Ceratobasidium sp. 428]
MFRPAGLFKSNQCPDQHCARSPCPLSHGPIPTPKSAANTQPVQASTDGMSRLLGKPAPSSSNPHPVTVARGSTAPTRGNHNTDVPGSSTLKPIASASSSAHPTSSSAGRPPVGAPRPTRLTPAPRVETTKRPVETSSLASSSLPPAKLPKVAPGPVRKVAPPSTTSLSATGAPILNINAANTNVPLKERQRMVT